MMDTLLDKYEANETMKFNTIRKKIRSNIVKKIEGTDMYHGIMHVFDIELL